MLKHDAHILSLKALGIDTYHEAVLFMRKDCYVCRSEGFEVHTRVRVTLNQKHILATLNTIEGELLGEGEASLSKYAWEKLGAHEGAKISLSHPKPLRSLSFVRAKVYGSELNQKEIGVILKDIVNGRYSDIHLATFLTACAGNRLSHHEIIRLTRSMVDVGKTISWPVDLVVDKHCVGGLPGNRTTLIVVPIVTAFGLTMPKTSSRAITSPAGTADTMETLAPVDLNLKSMKRVVEQEGGCIIWGGSVALSPADDALIRVARIMELDSEGGLIASVLSKKIAAGSTNVVIDIPVGLTAKVRSLERAENLKYLFEKVAASFDIALKIMISDGEQPVGRGIGPALEARDALAVLQRAPHAPQDLRERALILAGKILEFSPEVKSGTGQAIAKRLLDEGRAWQKFQAICEAQGGLREPPRAPYTHVITAQDVGRVVLIDNRQLSRLAKLAGAPHDKAAGVVIYTRLDAMVEKGQPLLEIHAESKGALQYACSLLTQIPAIVRVEACE